MLLCSSLQTKEMALLRIAWALAISQVKANWSAKTEFWKKEEERKAQPPPTVAGQALRRGGSRRAMPDPSSTVEIPVLKTKMAMPDLCWAIVQLPPSLAHS